MAKKKSSGEPARRRKRRSPEEMIEDLQKQISDLKVRAEAKKLKESPAIKAAASAVKAIDKCVKIAEEEEDTALRHVLADAREPLETYLAEQGMRLSKTRRPKGPRPK